MLETLWVQIFNTTCHLLQFSFEFIINIVIVWIRQIIVYLQITVFISITPLQTNTNSVLLSFAERVQQMAAYVRAFFCSSNGNSSSCHKRRRRKRVVRGRMIEWMTGILFAGYRNDLRRGMSQSTIVPKWITWLLSCVPTQRQQRQNCCPLDHLLRWTFSEIVLGRLIVSLFLVCFCCLHGLFRRESQGGYFWRCFLPGRTLVWRSLRWLCLIPPGGHLSRNSRRQRIRGADLCHYRWWKVYLDACSVFKIELCRWEKWICMSGVVNKMRWE